jgi:hydroxymethylbilane synthase
MLYPIALSVAGWSVLVVGGGVVGERRALGLLEAGARVFVVAPSLTPMLERLSSEGRIHWREGLFQSSDVEDMRLIVAATNDAAVNAQIVADARAHGVLVNDAVDAEHGDYRVPAVHRAGALTFAVESSGASPGFSRRLRRELSEHFGDAYGQAAETLRSLRAIIHVSVPLERRAAIMETFTELPVEELARMTLSQRENAVEEATHRDHEDRDALAEFVPATRICASRGSRLAIVQTRMVMALLAQAKIASTLIEIRSTGDRNDEQPLGTLGSGIFVNELESALQEKRADYAVHSCKDLPSMLGDGLAIAAVPLRVDARDAYCSEKYPTLADLPEGARVGTSSPRRRTQLRLLRPDLFFEEIRGNIDSRLRKLAAGEYDAIVLAMAGMERLNLRARFTVPFELHEIVPAVAQGALAIETRVADSDWVKQLRETLSDIPSELCVLAERGFLATVRGGCHAPIGAHAIIDSPESLQPELRIAAIIAAPSGLAAVRGEERITLQGPLSLAVFDDAREGVEAAGRRLATRLLDEGGRALLMSDAPLSGRRLLLGRTQDRPSRIAVSLRAAGAEVIEITEDSADIVAPQTLDGVLFPSSGSVAVVVKHLSPSVHADRSFFVAAMGPQSAETAAAAGFVPQVVSPQADIGSFVHAITQALLEQDR